MSCAAIVGPDKLAKVRKYHVLVGGDIGADVLDLIGGGRHCLYGFEHCFVYNGLAVGLDRFGDKFRETIAGAFELLGVRRMVADV